MLIDELNVLNEALYKACGSLKENKGSINKAEHQAIIEDNLFELYELDYKIICGKFEEQKKLKDEIEIKELNRKNEIERRKKELTPCKKRRWYWLFSFKKNRAEDLLARETEANAGIFLNTKEQAVKQLEKIIEEADKESSDVLKPLTRKEKRELKRKERKERKDLKKAAKTVKVKPKEKPVRRVKKKTGNEQLQGQISIEELDKPKGKKKADKPAAADTILTAEK